MYNNRTYCRVCSSTVHEADQELDKFLLVIKLYTVNRKKR